MKLIKQWLRHKAPILLETVRTGTDFTAAKIKYLNAPPYRTAHHFPVHKIIAFHIARQRRTAAVIRQHLILVIKIHHATHQLAVKLNRQHFALLAKHFFQNLEVFSGKNWRSEISNTF